MVVIYTHPDDFDECLDNFLERHGDCRINLDPILPAIRIYKAQSDDDGEHSFIGWIRIDDNTQRAEEGAREEG